MNKQSKNKLTSNKQQQLILNQTEEDSEMRSFLQKNKAQLIKGISVQKIKAKIVPCSQKYLQQIGQNIRNGNLVAFPTQTVYGLGADATNEKALLQIYKVKKRPLTDPIIVHILNQTEALKLVKINTQLQLEVFKKLTQKYWPGPLTIILKANLQILPLVVTAQTGFVGIRSPKSKYARQLIEHSGRPIGAPSANLFSHVSPTSPVHVFNDFYDQEITIVDGQRCQYGVESTVIKIQGNNIDILREGSLSTNKLKQFVQAQFGNKITIQIKKRVQKQDENNNMQSPGQLIKHYAPYLPCFSVSLEDLQKQKKSKILVKKSDAQFIDFKDAVLISFNQKFETFKQKFKYYLTIQQENYKQMSEQMDENQQKFCTIQQKLKMRTLYHMLRKAQNLDVKVILIGWNQTKQGTLWDKIFRSTQGKIANIQ